MKKTYSFISILLSIVLCISCLASCKNKEKNNPNTVEPSKQNIEVSSKILKLCYSTNDYLSPYQVESTVNQIIMPLMYDPLFRVDNALKATPLLATNGSINDTSVVVNINTNAKFSDGSNLTAEDVIYSFNRAVSSPAYSNNLSNFSAATATTNSSVQFTLKTKDKHALSCLDFAIVKKDSAPEIKINPSVPQTPPIGTGRYIYSDNGPVLIANTNWVGKETMSIGKIELVNIKTSKSIPHNLVLGNIDFYFDDLSSGSYSRINASTLDVPQTNFVFLGFNASNPILQNINVRTAIAMSLDRNSIVSSAYSNHARATSTPYPTDWYGLNDIKINTIGFDKKAASELLKSNGYETFSLRLIVNSDNSFRVNAANVIKEQLQSLGINVIINELSWENYTASLTGGYYDLYIGEVKLSNNLNLSSFFSAGGSATYGIDTSGICAAAYNQFINDEITLSNFLDTFNSEIPFIALCYCNGVVSFTRDLKSNVISYSNDVFYNIAEWKF